MSSAIPAIDYVQPIDSYSSAAGTNADYEGQLHALKIRTAIDEERKRNRELNAEPDTLDREIAARTKTNDLESLMPAGSTSRLSIDAPEDTGAGGAAIDRVLGDPAFRGNVNVGASSRGKPN